MHKFPYQLVDLTHALSSATPTWDGSCGFKHHLDHDYDPGAAYKFRTHTIQMSEGIGTHMDAPAHCVAGGQCIDEILLQDLVSPCIVIDVSKTAHERYKVSPDDIKVFEEEHGAINPGTFVMIRTGWERHWPDPEKYRNDHFFPSVSSDAAELFLQRGISGLGIDTLSPDCPEDGFPVHKLLLGAGKYLVENAANLSRMPPQGSFIQVVPIKIKDGTEAPVRLIGFIR